MVLPFVLAFILAFTDQRLVPNPDLPTRFIWFRNFVRMFDNEEFLGALWNNTYFVLLVTPIQTALALGMALAVNQKLKGVRLFRTIYFMPVATAMAVVAVIWTLLYMKDGGLINSIITTVSFGRIDPHDWLGESHLIMPAIMVLSIWQGAGYQMLIFLAGLQSIPIDLYESAMLDGANRWKQFRFITLPMLKNTMIFVIVTTTIFAFQLYAQIRIIKTGGSTAPIGDFRSMVYLIAEEGMSNQKIGYASAITVVFFLIVLVINQSQRIFMREERQIQ
jgi:multiple sugar transport system permease protein